jgi:hypothetical protein
VYPHIGDLTNLARYPPLKPNIIFFDYLLDHNLSWRMDHQFKEDCKMVPRLKMSSIFPKESISSTYLISITTLPEDKQTSKHGGEGRYNAILEFKGSKLKKKKKEKESKRKKNEKEKDKRNKEKYMYEKKEKKKM